jgi:hypothetical protein
MLLCKYAETMQQRCNSLVLWLIEIITPVNRRGHILLLALSALLVDILTLLQMAAVCMRRANQQASNTR